MVLARVEALVEGVADWIAIATIHLLHLRNWQSLGSYLRWNFVGRGVRAGSHATVYSGGD